MTRGISRQAFIRSALGTVAAGALASCREPARGPQAQPTTSASPKPSKSSDPQNWTTLDDAIDGHVGVPSNADYAAAKKVFNSRFAARNDIKVAVRGGGHSYVGASAADGALVIDLRRLPASPPTTMRS